MFILIIFAMREQTACAYTLTAVLINGLPFFLLELFVERRTLAPPAHHRLLSQQINHHHCPNQRREKQQE